MLPYSLKNALTLGTDQVTCDQLQTRCEQRRERIQQLKHTIKKMKGVGPLTLPFLVVFDFLVLLRLVQPCRPCAHPPPSSLPPFLFSIHLRCASVFLWTGRACWIEGFDEARQREAHCQSTRHSTTRAGKGLVAEVCVCLCVCL